VVARPPRLLCASSTRQCGRRRTVVVQRRRRRKLQVAQDFAVRTRVAGLACSLQAVDLNPTVRIEALAADGVRGLIDSGVPVVPGGFQGLRSATGIRISNPRPHAPRPSFSIRDRPPSAITGGALDLTPDGRGGAWATANLGNTAAASWLSCRVKSSQNSPRASFGLPLDAGAEPPQRNDVPDALGWLMACPAGIRA